MQTVQHTQHQQNAVLGSVERPNTPMSSTIVDNDLKIVIHRRTEEIFQRIRLIHSRLKTNKERLVFDYICDNTIRRIKPTDQIANSQFTKGKRCKKTGRVIDFGCGLTSIKPIREARRSLVKQGIVFEEAVMDECGKQQANRYGLTFIRDLLELHVMKNKCKSLEKHTGGGYYRIPPTIESPTEIIKQRCIATSKKKKRRKPSATYMDSAHVDYLIDQIEKITGDSHSRGAFAQVALTVDEGRIMELLSVLKDRDNIKNKGAWFLTVAKKCQSRRIIRADTPESPEKREVREQPVTTTSSFTEKLLGLKPELAELLDMNSKRKISAVHHKFITGT